MKPVWKQITVSIVLVLLLTVSASHFESVSAQRHPVVKKLLQEILQEKGLSPEELRTNPELQQQVREEIERRSSDPEIREQIREKLLEHKRTEQSQSQEGPKGHEVIIQKNLFKPLGSGDEKKGPAFALQGVIIPSDGGPKRALIFEFSRNQLHDVKEGERAGNASVVLIEPRHVRLQLDGEEQPIELRMDDMQFIGGGGRGGGRRGGGAPPNVRPSSGAARAAAARAKREHMQGRSPEEVRKMMEQQARKFRERREREGRGRSGRRPRRGDGVQPERLIMGR